MFLVDSTSKFNRGNPILFPQKKTAHFRSDGFYLLRKMKDSHSKEDPTVIRGGMS